MNPKMLAEKLHWLGHDSFRLDGPAVVYFDPWKLSGSQPAADLVLVSHEHFDHLSPEDIDKVRGPRTVVVASTAAAAKLPGALVARPGEVLQAAGLSIEAVPAYNVSKFRSPGVPFHPPAAGHVGYIVTVEGVRLYFAGDTDHIPEMSTIRCDVALLPVSGTYVMTVEEAADAARTIRPAIVVPMHYGSGIGTAGDGERLRSLYAGEVVLLERE